MENKRLLVIGLVWPEPTSSAAGTRMIQLINLFLANGFEVFFASAANKSEFSYNLPSLGVRELEIKLNDPSFDIAIKQLSPEVVMFDRFATEEQYSWRVQEACPDALTILDTEDLYFLRRHRQDQVKTARDPQLFNDIAKREIAAILRTDISLIISEYEMQLLNTQFRIDPSIIYYLPFMEDIPDQTNAASWKTFEEREGFTFIGNFLHEPNWHAVQLLKTKIWPNLSRTTAAGMHIYGAYAGPKVMQFHNPRERFYVHGRVDDARKAIGKHRLLLAPLLFGAGLKGKFIDAMQAGTPSVTTTIGAEAMSGKLHWPGFVSDDLDDFSMQAAVLYHSKELWQHAQENGLRLLSERYDKNLHASAFIILIRNIHENLNAHRNNNFMGAILKSNLVNASKYMSLWISEKNKNKNKDN